MPFVVIVAIVAISLLALAAGVVDTTRSTARQGGAPDIALTYRAYSA